MSASENRRGGEYDRSPERFNDAAFRHRFPRCRENVFALARASDCGLRCRDPTLDKMVSLVVASSGKRFVLADLARYRGRDIEQHRPECHPKSDS